MFEELFIKMNEEVKKNSRTYKEAPNMSVEEKTISFLNRYFIYKKVRKVSDVEQIASNLQHKTVEEIEEASPPPPPTDVAAATATSAAATAATATASAAAAPTTKTKTKTATAKTATAKTATVKAKTTKKNQPILSVITEESEPSMPVPVPMSSAMPVPVPAMPVPAMPVPAMPVPAMPVPEVAPALEKKTVRKYTRKLKI
jgi:hypothetical protein